MHNDPMKYLFILSFFFSTLSFANICVKIPNFETEAYSFRDDIDIFASDGVEIHGNLFKPKKAGKLPLIVFVNSWVLEEHEYFKQAKELASAGYLVFSYSTRGWGCSGGKIEAIGPRDIEDLETVLNWIENNTPVDSANIGMSGISYGGGMSLMAAAKVDRIKTVAAMSAWGSLTDAIYGANTPRQFWASSLIATGAVIGEVDTKLLKLFKALITHEGTGPAINWANERSPIEFIELVNRKQIPIYISNNFGDNLFQPNNILDYFQKLRVPKILDLNQGTHASAEISGLIYGDNFSFSRMQAWFDYWLKGEPQTGLKFNEISMQLDLKTKREYFSATNFFKAPELKLNLTPRGYISHGGLSTQVSSNEDIDTIYSGVDTRASSGIPVLSAMLDGHLRIPVFNTLPWIQRVNGIYYKSKRFKKGLKLRGIPKLRLTTSSEGKHYQLLAYLYDRSPLGVTRLITHGAATSVHHDGKKEVFDLDLVATAYDLDPGHSLVLAIDTEDLLYAKPLHLIPYETKIHFSQSHINELRLPVID